MDDDESDYLEKYIFPESITIEELIKKLSEYPMDMKVCTTWEGMTNSLKKENIYLSKWKVVFIDADQNFYKEQYKE